ncbi:MAG: disulfide bond formation protein B [Deltaproteobacteria bacterium]
MNPALARNLNALGVLGICGVLLGAYFIQFVKGEFPCPLCLLQRLGMLGVAFGAMLNLRFGIRPSHYGISLLSAVFGASVSVRQILLHIVPGTGSYGSPVLGLHLYTWAFVVFVAAIFLIGLMMLWERQFRENHESNSPENMSRFIKTVFFLAVFISASNVVTTFLECGPGQCPDNPVSYEELR